MRLSTDVLFGLLSERYRLNRFGKGIRARELSLPTFFMPNTPIVPGSIYVARTGDLPNKPPEDCVFICCGTKPPNVWNMWPCEIIYVMDARDDIIGVFNTTQRILDRLVTWDAHMQKLATSGAHIKEMVEESIPLFENRITVTDYELNILAYCEMVEDSNGRTIRMSDRYAQVPLEKMPMVSRQRMQAMRQRDPFFIEEADAGDSYCINLFLGDTYIGTCALQEEDRPLRPLDLELFEAFSGYVRDALAIQSRSVGNQLVTAKTIFDQLLNGFPVSQYDMTHALRLVELNLGNHSIDGYRWCCVVIQNARRGRTLPEAYLSAALGSILPNATVVPFDDSIVVFCLIGEDEHRLDEICDPLEAYLRDMGLKAGVSRTFHDPFKVRSYYQQAVCAMMTGYEREPEKLWYLFGDYVLDYMLQSCCGDFDAKLIVAPELVRLAASGASGVDLIDTLRAFLDNDCNASRTAKAMYLHRSTLIQRLDRIRKTVDLDSPERRLYLQMCLHLPDIEHILSEASE